MNTPYHQRGQLTLYVLVFSAVAITTLAGLILWVDSNLKIGYRSIDQAQAQAIAEAGIEYARWHFAHSPNDYQDGTGHAGPYVHDYKNKDGVSIGTFSLDIVPPANGSTIITITSTGWVTAAPTLTKKIRVQLAPESVIKYAVLANSNIKFESGTEIFGPVHSNGGIHFDGIAHNLVTSARSTYNDPDHSGANEYAVHTHATTTDPLPTAQLPVRNDIFMGGRLFPVPPVDFAGITKGMAQIKSAAQSGGKYFGKSGAKGYHIVLKTNGTYTVTKVKKTLKIPKGCKNTQHQKGWATWSIDSGNSSEQTVGTYNYPANGIIFFEDNVWVDGQIKNNILTIAAAKLPASKKSFKNIIINHSVAYTYYDGRDVLGLVSQGDVHVGMASDATLRVDAAVVAQNGRVGRYYYRPAVGSKTYCAPYDTRTSITFNGMIATNTSYGFAYTDGSGYQSRTILFDAHLQYNPPPTFPLISTDYHQILWSQL